MHLVKNAASYRQVQLTVEGQIRKAKGTSEFVEWAHDGTCLPRQQKIQGRKNGDTGATLLAVNHFANP